MIELSSYVFEALHKDKESILSRGRSKDDASQVLVLSPVAEHPAPESVKRLEHEYSLRDALDPRWAARPMALAGPRGRPVLVLEDPGGVPLDQMLGHPVGLAVWLRLAIGLASAIAQLHQRGLIHKDLKPAHVMVNAATGQCWLMGFGIASRLARERQAPKPPEVIAGTLAYMAPEQTGRMNRSIDSRSDLYSLGVTLYELLTGSLPFAATEPMEWVHCHIARQPVPPADRVKEVPATASAIVMKLLAKAAEDRYQTAAGAERDLRRCLAEWDTRGRIDDFPLGEYDTPDRLLIPETLYGRAREIETLLAAFDRVLASGTPELVLVSGYSGIGKSSVVNELHKALVPPRGLFASGKLDRYKRDIPYSTLAQAFQGLIRPLLGKGDAELSPWRAALRAALDPNGRLIVDLVPELALILGEQPPVPELAPQDAQRRFQLVFRRFIRVFARPEHPLALFLDDLQWLDAATLDLLEDLSTQADVRHLLLIGAYRDNEVSDTHPLMRKLQAIRRAGARVQDVVLAPLTCEDLGRLIGDSLHCEPVQAAPLAQLVHQRTAGNPFFAIQFITALAEEELLRFDHASRSWAWDVSRIGSKGYTDKVVDLMLAKLNRLPVETQKALKAFACLGNRAEITTLTIVHGTSEEKVHADLWEALRLEFIVRLEGSYRFVHDRVQEAAYLLIPEELRAETHLQIGRLLTAHTPPERREESIFEMVNQLNRGAVLITSRGEREQLAEFNLLAGKRAKASTAYTSALKYFIAGAALLADDRWERRHELSFALELYRAECEFLTGELAAAEERLTMLSSRAANTIELATVTCVRSDLYTTLDRSDRAVDVCLSYLRHLGIEWSPHPAEEEVRREYERTWSLVGQREIEELIDLPLMSKPESVATLDVLSKTLSPACFTDANLVALILWRMVNLSLEHGNTDASCFAYVHAGANAGRRFGNYKAGFRFGRLGYDLVERHGLRRFEARAYLSFAVVIMSWTKPLRMARDLIRHAFDVANTIGDLMYAAYSWHHLIANLLAAGDPLVDVQREAERGLEYAQKARFGLEIDLITTQLALIRTLRGLTATFGCFNGAQFDELQFERHLASKPALAFAACWYWTRKLQARFFGGDHACAVDASLNAQRLLWTSPSFLESAEAHFYGALSHAASCDAAFPLQYRQHFEALVAHHRQLALWAENCPENFLTRVALVGAEIARIEGRELDAERLYERAIRSAQANGFVHNEALANELAARFYAGRGFEDFAHLYLRRARNCYLRWGADGKVQQLDELHPDLKAQEPLPGPARTIEAPVEHLDLATVLKVSQAVSGEIVLEKLIDTLMRTAIEHAGAERGLLIFPREVERWIEAEATTSGDAITVRLHEAVAPGAAVPESIVHYVMRTHESVILDDASAHNTFSSDPYICRHHARSLLCLSLTNQAKLIGLLYLENSLTTHVFTPTRVAVLKLLASQAAISLENTRLYREQKRAEAALRRSEAYLSEAQRLSRTGSFGWDVTSRKIYWSQETFRIFGYNSTTEPRLELVLHRTHPEDRARVQQVIDRVSQERKAFDFEHRLLMPDGSVKYLRVVGHPSTNALGNLELVGAVTDITGRTLADKALQQKEVSLRETQTELAHVNRVTTMGELAASIAHEVNQPLMGIVTNASASLRLLARDSPDLAEAGEALRAIIRDGNRAAEVVSRMRALFKKARPAKERLNLNEAIDEVVILTKGEARRNKVTLRTELAANLPSVLGDRVQIQQVVMNLILNGIEAMRTVQDRERALVVRTQRGEGDRVRVSVQDSGVGFDPANAKRMFDAFHTTKPGGMGMGLSISRSIVEGHGGRLWATANDGPGATFQFTL